MEAAMAKLYLSECFVQSGMDAIRTHGGYGYMTEFEVSGIFVMPLAGQFIQERLIFSAILLLVYWGYSQKRYQNEVLLLDTG
jgi:alkylation response protein AidB-like acyl-CoA dehydrogenase